MIKIQDNIASANLHKRNWDKRLMGKTRKECYAKNLLIAVIKVNDLLHVSKVGVTAQIVEPDAPIWRTNDKQNK